MSNRKRRLISLSTVAVGILLFVKSRTAPAQQPTETPAPPTAAPRTPPPDPRPPQPGTAASTPTTDAANFEPGYLGVVADDRQEKGAGVRVIELEAGGPAEQGGLKADDLITSINDTPVHGQNDMGPVLQKLAPGSKVKFVVDRAGQQQTVEVTLGQRPPVAERRFEKFGAIPEPLPEPKAGGGLGPDVSGAEPGRIPTDVAPNGLPNNAPSPGPRFGDSVPGAPPDQPLPDARPLRLGTNDLRGTASAHRPLLGVRTQPVTEETRQRLRLPSTNGAHVVSRTVGSPAVQAGIPLDAVITAVDGKPIIAPIDLTQLVVQAGAGREIEITYLFGGTEQRAKVKLAEFAAGSTGTPGSLLGGGSISAGAIPTPPAPQPGHLPVPDDKTRIDSLERRVQQLEHRVDDLEQALNRSK